MTRLILIRHGQTDWNAEGRWQGQADPPLNQHGREQAQRVAQELASQKLTVLYSSDLNRALETARIIGTELGLEVIPDVRLREIRLGLWQGMLSTDIQSQYPEEFREWYVSPPAVRPPGGEDLTTLAKRVLEVTNEIIRRHPSQVVGIIAHEFPIAVVRCRATGIGLERIREMIPSTGTWEQIVCDGELK